MTVEELAQELHRFYRAAFKVFDARPHYCYIGNHDHGWVGCHQKKYFLKRAAMILKEENVTLRSEGR